MSWRLWVIVVIVLAVSFTSAAIYDRRQRRRGRSVRSGYEIAHSAFENDQSFDATHTQGLRGASMDYSMYHGDKPIPPEASE